MNPRLHNLIPTLHRYRRPISVISSVIGTAAIITLQIYRSPLPLRTMAANLGSHSAAIVFMTYEATDACAYVFAPKELLKGRLVCDADTTTHLLEVDKLSPSTTYQVWLKSGLRFAKSQLSFTTSPIPENAPALPTPAFGAVKTFNNAVVVDALVIVFPDQDINRAVVTKTNLQGNYALDISPFTDSATTLTVDASTVEGLWGNEVFPVDYHAPFNDIIVNYIVPAP